ncbi:MAG: hypothetical protein AB9M53_00390 [Leptothrix sp. (in: b-proteobacteria)]
MMACRESIAAAAMAWVGTPYHHHARLRGVGVDCAQLLAAVYSEVGLVPALDLGDYPVQWHLHRDEEAFLAWLVRCGATRRHEPPAVGDVGVWRYGRAFSHGGIVVEAGDDPLIAHAYIGRGVVLTRLSEQPLGGREHQFWGLL